MKTLCPELHVQALSYCPLHTATTGLSIGSAVSLGGMDLRERPVQVTEGTSQAPRGLSHKPYSPSNPVRDAKAGGGPGENPLKLGAATSSLQANSGLLPLAFDLLVSRCKMKKKKKSKKDYQPLGKNSSILPLGKI